MAAQRVLEDRLVLAGKLRKQAVDSGHQLLAETWADKAREAEGEMHVVRSSLRRTDRVAESSEKRANLG